MFWRWQAGGLHMGFPCDPRASPWGHLCAHIGSTPGLQSPRRVAMPKAFEQCHSWGGVLFTDVATLARCLLLNSGPE